MRLRTLLSLCAILTAGATAAAAATVTANVGADLVLGFRADGGTGAPVNLEVNLGAITTYTGAGSSKQAVAALSAADLSSSYGSSWNTRSDVYWGIVGSTGNSLAGFTTYVTYAVAAPGTQSTPYEAQSKATLNSAGAAINGAVSGLNGMTATANSAVSAKVTAGDPLSWSSYEFITPGVSFNVFDTVSVFENVTTVSSGSYAVSDLYQLKAGVVNYVGTFALDSSGVLWFSKNPADFAPPAPVIVTQPESISVSAGSAASFTAAATGIPQPTYTWQLSTDGGSNWSNVPAGSPYSGSASATLQISSAAFAMNGYRYRVMATNTLGAAFSDAATLTVTLLAPSIDAQPVAQTVTTGAGTSFSVTASGTAVTYQWQVSTDGGSNWSALTNTSPYAGATSATLTLSATTFAMNGYRYRVLVTNAASSAALLTVDVPPSVTTGPQNGTVHAGAPATFSVTAAGSPAPSYRWQLSTDGGSHWNDLSDTAPYSGTATATLGISAVTAAMEGYLYRAVLANTAGSLNSDAATLNVVVPPSITIQPAENEGTTVGGSVELSVTATGTAPLTYQWRRGTPGDATDLTDGDGVSGSTTATLTLTGDATSTAGAATYFVEVINAAGSDVSDLSTVTVAVVQVSPTITNPVSGNANRGGSFTFTVSATGVPTPTIQWFKDGNAVPGATSVSLKLTALQAADAGQYWAVATNGAGVATSDPAALAVNLAPTIVTAPQDVSVDKDLPASFSVVATGTPAPVYRWQVSTDAGGSWSDVADGPLYSGATSATLSLSAATGGMDGYRYRVVTSNVAGNATSDPAALTVIKGLATVTLGNLAATYDGTPKSATSTTAPSGLAVALTYDGSSTAPTAAGSYAVVGTIHDDNYTGSATGTLVIGRAVPTVAWSAPAAITYGASLSAAQLNATASIPGAWVYAPAAGTMLGAGGHTLQATFTPTDARNYTGATATVALTVNPAPLVAIAADANRGYGESNPALAIGYEGFVGGDTVAALSEVPLASTEATADSEPGTYPIVLSGGAAANYTLTLRDGTLTIFPVSYQGFYFGTFGAGGTWALMVRSDNTAEFIGYLAGRKSALALPVTIDKTGTFSVAGTELTTTRTVAALADRVGLPVARAAAAGAFTLTGKISGHSVSGTVDGLGTTLAGSFDATSGPVPAGYYTSKALYTAQGSLYAIASPGGRAVAVLVTPTLVDGASGQAGTDGAFALKSSAGTTIAFALDPADASLSATVTPAKTSGPVYFSGTADTTSSTAHLTVVTAETIVGPGEDALTVAFTTSGSGAKPLLLRGVGPGLGAFGVTDALRDPVLTVYADGKQIASNDDWTGSVTAITTALGAYPLRTGSLDSALYSATRFTPGSYTFRILDQQGGSGRAMAELYDAQPAGLAARLLNVTARGRVGTGSAKMVAGLTVDGTGPLTLLVRAVGPGLSRDALANPLADPQLRIHRKIGGQDTLVASNDNWGGDATLSATFTAVEAYALDESSKDAALLATLAPGVYSIEISGADGGTGVARLELYTVDGSAPSDTNAQPPLPEPPAITAQPMSQTATAGTSVQFTVTATGNPAPTYQWYFEGSPIKNATGRSLSLSAVKSSDGGNYTVVATNSAGSATSTAAVLTVQAGGDTGGGSSGGGGSAGGGGAPSGWFLVALGLLALARGLVRRRGRAAHA